MVEVSLEDLPKPENWSEVINRRVHQNGKFGTVRYYGRLLNNPKAGLDNWLGIEWDEASTGKHDGTVDGIEYFVPQYQNLNPEFAARQTKCCSFIRWGKISIQGISIQEALKKQYQGEDEMTEEEKKMRAEEEEMQLFAMAGKGGKSKKIEVLGQDQSYKWRSQMDGYEFVLQIKMISDLGPPGAIRDLIPNCQRLYLDKNLLHSWDQFFQITSEIRFLSTLVLTGNKFAKIKPDYFEGKNIDHMINPHLKELILIDMGLTWDQIDTLMPTLIYVEQLHLVRNQCNEICSKFEIKKDYFKNLKFLNLEQNHIKSWDEVSGFRVLQNLKRLTMTKNLLTEVKYQPGWNDLYVIKLEDNLIDSWHSFDELNKFKGIKQIRYQRNPIAEKNGVSMSRLQVTARCEFVNEINGSEITENNRKDAELYYTKSAYENYLETFELKEKVEDLHAEEVAKFMNENHPRFYQLVQIYGSPVDLVDMKKAGSNISSGSATVRIISMHDKNQGKEIKKKLITSMTVSALKSLIAKLLKVEILEQRLTYHQEEYQSYELDEDFRQLSYYGVAEGSEIHVNKL